VLVVVGALGYFFLISGARAERDTLFQENEVRRAEVLKAKADEAKAGLTAGTLVIFKGPLESNAGKQILAAGQNRGQTDIELEKMDYLVKGVKGSLN